MICAALLSGMLAANAPIWAESKDRITVDDVQAELSEAYTAIGKFTLQERDDALSAVDDTLIRIDGEIDLLEQRARQNWADMSQAARNRTTAVMLRLRIRRNRLGEMYGALRFRADAAWNDLTIGLTRAWQDLEAAWDDAVDDANTNSEM